MILVVVRLHKAIDRATQLPVVCFLVIPSKDVVFCLLVIAVVQGLNINLLSPPPL